jgi:hypothetical protein
MKTSRLRSNFSRKYLLRKRNDKQTKKHKKTKKRHHRLHRGKTRYIMHGTKKNKKLIMNGGGPINFKKYNGYNVYDQPVENVSYSGPMEWED